MKNTSRSPCDSRPPDVDEIFGVKITCSLPNGHIGRCCMSDSITGIEFDWENPNPIDCPSDLSVQP